MVKDALDSVAEVQVPQLALTDGDWLRGVRLDCLRNRYQLALAERIGRRAGECLLQQDSAVGTSTTMAMSVNNAEECCEVVAGRL